MSVTKRCSIDGCERRAVTRGWCSTHYARWQRHGDPLTVIVRERDLCSVADCSRLAAARGMCHMHAERMRKHGTTDSPVPTIADRFWAQVDRSDGCWVWTGYRMTSGYGLFYIAQQGFPAHRIAYVLDGNVIPDGLQIDHLCRNRPCVRPSHLEPVTPAENIRRGMPFRAPIERRLKGECIHGHALVGDNVYVRPDTGTRMCRRCYQERFRERYARAQTLAAERGLTIQQAMRALVDAHRDDLAAEAAHDEEVGCP